MRPERPRDVSKALKVTIFDSFPLDLVFRIFDSVFGHGIEAIFGFSICLLIKNEEQLLKIKFDQILDYMKGDLFDIYKVRQQIYR